MRRQPLLLTLGGVVLHENGLGRGTAPDRVTLKDLPYGLHKVGRVLAGLAGLGWAGASQPNPMAQNHDCAIVSAGPHMLIATTPPAPACRASVVQGTGSAVCSTAVVHHGTWRYLSERVLTGS